MKKDIAGTFKEAIVAHQNGDIKKAERYYNKILSQQPEHSEANHNIGVIAVYMGELDIALRYFNTALHLNPKKPQFWLSIIETMLNLGHVTKAEQLLNEAEEKGLCSESFDALKKKLNSNNGIVQPKTLIIEPPHTLLQPIFDVFQQGEYDLALTKARHLLTGFPKSSKILNICGAANAALENFEAAIQDYKLSIGSNPKLEDAYYNLANCHSKLGNTPEAVRNYKLAISLKPNHANAYFNLGNAFQADNQLTCAINSYKSCIKILSSHFQALNNLGVALQKCGKREEAINNFTQALKVNPKFISAQENLLAILKTIPAKVISDNAIVRLDQKFKNYNVNEISLMTDQELSVWLSKVFCQLHNSLPNLRTSLSQIYRSNDEDLNCKRHMGIFNENKIIPEFCFSCFKVQVNITNIYDLIRITAALYEHNYGVNLTRKSMIELRPNISGTYKTIVYCKTLSQAENVRNSTSKLVTDICKNFAEVNIKRGCSEYAIEYSDYSDPYRTPDFERMDRTKLRKIEADFDKQYGIKPVDTLFPSRNSLCLSDILVLQKWLDYASGLQDFPHDKVEFYNVVYQDIKKEGSRRRLV